MEIRCLKTFIEVAERSNFTRAAEALGYTQSTISAQIKQLECELGTQLFERINHNVTLTESGGALLDRAHKIINMVEEIKTDPAEEENPTGLVRYAMAPSICNIMMGNTYLTFRKMYPNVKVEILEADTDQLLTMLDHNDVDVVFIVDRREIRKDYIVASEKREPVHFIAPVGHPLCGRRELDIKEVLSHTMFLTERRVSYRELFDRKLAERGLSITPAVEMSNTNLVLELVELGAGISFLPDYVTRDSRNAGRIEYLDVKDFDIDVWRQLMYHKNKWLTPAMKRVIEYCAGVSEAMI